MRYYAAIIIQSAWRGFLARKFVRKLSDQRSILEAQQAAAATTIAAHYKGFLQKKKFDCPSYPYRAPYTHTTHTPRTCTRVRCYQ